MEQKHENKTVPQHSPLPWVGRKSGLNPSSLAYECFSTEAGEVFAFTGNKENNRLITASVNAMGELAQYLNCNPVELAERLQGGGLVELVKALEIALPLLVASYLDLERVDDTGQDIVFAASEAVKESLARLTGKNNI